MASQVKVNTVNQLNIMTVFEVLRHLGASEELINEEYRKSVEAYEKVSAEHMGAGAGEDK